MDERKQEVQSEVSVGDQIKVRREKLAQLQAEGRDPFKLTKFVVTSSAQTILTSWKGSLSASRGA